MPSKSTTSNSPSAKSLRGYGTLHAALILFGSAGLYVKLIHMHPVLIVFWRVTIASATFAIFMWGVGWPARLERLMISKREAWLLVGGGAILAFHWFTFFYSIRVSTVAIGLLSYSTAPAFTVLLEPLLLKERFSFKTLLFALITTAGVALVIPRWDISNSVTQGVLWGLCSGFSFSLVILLNRKLVQKRSGVQIAFLEDVVAMVVLIPLTPLVWSTPSLSDLGWLLLLGVFGTALAHALFIQSMALVKAGVAAISSALEPVYGILMAMLILGEIPTLRTLAGGSLILLAVAMASLPAFNQSK